MNVYLNHLKIARTAIKKIIIEILPLLITIFKIKWSEIVVALKDSMILAN